MQKIPTVFMRGGTSKGAVFHEKDLPKDKSQWDDIFLKVMGSPDPKQIDGLGGCVSSNNKIAIIKKSKRLGVDIDYTVAQVIIDRPQVDYKSNCGNMSSVIGPFAIDEGLVEPKGDITKVHLYNENTDKYLDADVPIKDGKFSNYGDCSIAGVLGTSAEIKLAFKDPAGAVTGKLFPTGNRIDTINAPDIGSIDVTIIDVSNPLILLRAEDLGFDATELLDDINKKDILLKFETIRGKCAEKIGMVSDWKKAAVETPAIPKIAFLNKPKQYKTLTGEIIEAETHDICARVISLNKLHKAYVLTAATATAVAAELEGTIANEFMKPNVSNRSITIAHPSGVMKVFPNIQYDADKVNVIDVAVVRTARKIMDGSVYIK